MRTVIFALCAILSAGPAQAGPSVFRCTGAAGEVMFSQVACGDGGVTIEARPVQAIGDGLRATERDWLKSRGNDRRKATSRRSDRAAQSDAAKHRQAYRCRRTRQQLDAVQAERRRGYKAGKGTRLRERAERYRTYLDSFCS